MVQRESQQRLSSAAGSSQVQGGRVGFKAPDFTTERPSSTDELLGVIVKSGTQLAEAAWEQSKEEAYLEGVAQVNQIKSEAELESSPLTAAWTTAGYRDTAGRLKLAENEAQIASDMATMREKSPEEFQKYLAEKRQAMLPQMEGMSRQQRSSVFAQLLQQEQSATQSHTEEHAKYIVDTETKSINALTSLRQDALNKTFGDAQAYGRSVNDFVSTLYTNVWQNPKLDEGLRQKLTTEAATFALSENHLQVFDRLQSMEVTFADGKKGKMFDRLPRTERTKLANARRAADDRLNVVQQYDWKREGAMLRARVKEGDPSLTYSDIKQWQNIGMEQQWEVDFGIEADFYQGQKQQQTSQGTVQAMLTGDHSYMRRNGISDNDALKTFRKAYAELPPAEYASLVLSVAQQHGSGWASKEFGNVIKDSVQEIMTNPEAGADSVATVQMMMQARDQMRSEGKGVQNMHMLRGLSEEQQKFIVALDRTGDVTEAKRKVEEWSKAGPVLQAAAGQAIKEASHTVVRMDTQGMMDQLGLGVKFWSSGAQAQLKIGVEDWWFKNPDETRLAIDTVRSKVSEEVQNVSLDHPWMRGEELYNMAVARVAERTVDTKQGPLILPEGVNMHEVFGAPAVANEGQIGLAISELQTWPEDTTWTFTDGTLTGHVKGKDGMIYPKYNIKADNVGKKVQEILTRDFDEQSAIVGPGVERSGVTFNGENTAGASPRVAFMLRDSLVAQEGVRTTPYEDGKGTSFGVGISSTGGFFEKPAGPDGSYTKEQISRSFLEASDHALNQGVKLARWANVRNDATVLLLSNVAYQNEKDARELAAAIKTAKMLRNPTVAEAVLRETAGFKAAGEQRQNWRLQQLRNALGE